MMCISIGSSSNDEAGCEIGRAVIAEDESSTVEAASDAFDMVGGDSAGGRGKRSCNGDNESSCGELRNEEKCGWLWCGYR